MTEIVCLGLQQGSGASFKRACNSNGLQATGPTASEAWHSLPNVSSKLSTRSVASPSFQVVLEAMKMEYAVAAPCDGTVKHVCVQQGDMVQQGSPLCLVVEE